MKEGLWTIFPPFSPKRQRNPDPGASMLQPPPFSIPPSSHCSRHFPGPRMGGGVKGMEEGGKGGGDSPYSLEEGVIHSSMWGRK